MMPYFSGIPGNAAYHIIAFLTNWHFFVVRIIISNTLCAPSNSIRLPLESSVYLYYSMFCSCCAIANMFPSISSTFQNPLPCLFSLYLLIALHTAKEIHQSQKLSAEWWNESNGIFEYTTTFEQWLSIIISISYVHLPQRGTIRAQWEQRLLR